MAKTKHVAGNPAIDPTIVDTQITLNGTVRHLVFTFKALAIAQKSLNDSGIRYNLLANWDWTAFDATVVAPFLYAALITSEPNITYSEVESLVTFRAMPIIIEGLIKAYQACMAEPEETENVPLANAE